MHLPLMSLFTFFHCHFSPNGFFVGVSPEISYEGVGMEADEEEKREKKEMEHTLCFQKPNLQQSQ